MREGEWEGGMECRNKGRGDVVSTEESCKES